MVVVLDNSSLETLESSTRDFLLLRVMQAIDVAWGILAPSITRWLTLYVRQDSPPSKKMVFSCLVLGVDYMVYQTSELTNTMFSCLVLSLRSRCPSPLPAPASKKNWRRKDREMEIDISGDRNTIDLYGSYVPIDQPPPLYFLHIFFTYKRFIFQKK